MICSKTLSYFSHSSYVLNLKVKLGPTDLIYLVPLSSFDIATARNPNQFGRTDGISVSPRWPFFLTVTCFTISVSPSLCNRSHRVGLTDTLLLVASLRSHRVDAIGATELMFALSPSTSVPPSCSSWSHQDSKRSDFELN